MSGAKVVDGDQHAELAQLTHDLGGPARVGHHGGLGELDLEVSGWKAALRQQVLDRFDKVVLGQISR